MEGGGEIFKKIKPPRIIPGGKSLAGEADMTFSIIGPEMSFEIYWDGWGIGTKFLDANIATTLHIPRLSRAVHNRDRFDASHYLLFTSLFKQCSEYHHGCIHWFAIEERGSQIPF